MTDRLGADAVADRRAVPRDRAAVGRRSRHGRRRTAARSDHAARVIDGAGDPVPDGLIEIWQADPDGRFAAPGRPARAGAAYPGFRAFGRCPTDADGEFGSAPSSRDGSDDEQAPHIDVTVFARGLLKHLVTRIYFPDEAAANAADPCCSVLAERERAR